MTHSLLHTPDGVRDIYNQECARKMELQDRLKRLMEQYGYGAIQTPTFEFFDIFGKEIGTTPSKDLYKFFDREGNTLVLRPDITPSIARAVTKYFSQEDMPIRLWYQGNTFINNSSYQGRLKESTQLGAELIGDDSVDADAEIISLVVNALKAAGLQEFQITIGHADILKILIQEAGFSQDVQEELLDLISNKNFFGVEELVGPLPMAPELKSLFGCLGVLYDNNGQLLDVLKLAEPYPRLWAAVKRLAVLYQVLGYYGADSYVSLELGISSSFHYYTGIIFAAYTFGSGEPIVKGGRYDDLLPFFGKHAPSIGFAVVVDQLMAALSRQKIMLPLPEGCRCIIYTPDRLQEAIAKANDLRGRGEKVVLNVWQEGRTKEDYEAYGKRFGYQEPVFFQ
ncbi:MAG: ATP phosphoribosyltransferase regulatory subunit [Lachnospiraceae bacterium]|jgi:ATP phosphoribosyltransferase regulatory subunit|nr:ATP phosphoribosyltransferase regulatory subunit [Lachnospiraceae bacterium]